jgi:hypothetical protein
MTFKYGIYGLLIVILICFISFSIYHTKSRQQLENNSVPDNTQSNNKTKNNITPINTTSNYTPQSQKPNMGLLGENNDISINDFERIIKTIINDDIWYKGVYSDFKGFENQTTTMEIYSTKKSSDGTLLIYFNTTFKYYGGQEKPMEELYYLVKLSKHGTKGYGNSFSLVDKVGTIDKVTKELTSLESEALLLKVKIMFDPAKQPVYPGMNDTRKMIAENIKKSVFNTVKKTYGDKAGNYHVTIRNFRDEDYYTYAIVEDGKSVEAIMTFTLQDTAVDLSQFKSFHNNEPLSYAVNQYKKVALSEDDLTFLQVKVAYENSENKFSLIFPSSWTGKYTVLENDKMTDFYYLPKNKLLEKALLFRITRWGTEAEWDEWQKTTGKDSGFPFQKIGVVSGFVYTLETPSGIPYSKDEDKEEATEYLSMKSDKDTIAKSFKSIN